jgi:transposase
MARGKKHDDETRAAVIAALLAGQGVGEVAKAYKLPESTIYHIKSNLSDEEFVKLRNKKREKLADLIESHLTASLNAAIRIADKTQDGKWLNKQSADSLGTFFGITTDKAVRILEAAESANIEETKD